MRFFQAPLKMTHSVRHPSLKQLSADYTLQIATLESAFSEVQAELNQLKQVSGASLQSEPVKSQDYVIEDFFESAVNHSDSSWDSDL
jgi:oligoendopeptidase F